MFLVDHVWKESIGPVDSGPVELNNNAPLLLQVEVNQRREGHSEDICSELSGDK